jgi:hypothetical protein
MYVPMPEGVCLSPELPDWVKLAIADAGVVWMPIAIATLLCDYRDEAYCCFRYALPARIRGG